jgi:hypothetical protein
MKASLVTLKIDVRLKPVSAKKLQGIIAEGGSISPVYLHVLTNSDQLFLLFKIYL